MKPRRVPALPGATVSIVGLGGLGSPAAAQLAAAGVGRLRLIDDDIVDLSNLHRQPLYREDDIGQRKCDRAVSHLRALHGSIAIEPVALRVNEQNLATVLGDSDFVIDGSDRIATKYLLNDRLVQLGIPFVHAGVTGLRAQALTILPGVSACLRCIFPDSASDDATPACEDAGVIGPLPALFGILQALEAIKFLSGSGRLLSDRLLTYDGGSGRWHTTSLERDRSCAVCALAGFR